MNHAHPHWRGRLPRFAPLLDLAARSLVWRRFLVPSALGLWLAMATVPTVAQAPADGILVRRSTASLNPSVTSPPVSGQAAASQLPAPSHSFPTLRPRAATAGQAERSGQQPANNDPRIPQSLITVGSSLAVVLGLFVGLIWLTRRLGGRAGHGGAIPSDVLQPLGSTPLDGRTRLTMFRCGHRIVVIAQGPTGVQPITEITAPDEVRDLTAACLGSSKRAFAATLQSIEQEPAAAGFVGQTAAVASPRGRGRLFASA